MRASLRTRLEKDRQRGEEVRFSPSPSDSENSSSLPTEPNSAVRAGPGDISGTPAPSNVAERIRQASGGGSALDSEVESTLSPRFGYDLSRIRVHSGREADELARAVDARAFTTGNDIFFRAGAYAPGTSEGMHTIAHEIAHVRQQAAGPVAGTPATAGLSISNPADSFEQEAERVADTVLSGGSAVALLPAGGGTLAVQRELHIQRDPAPGTQTADPDVKPASPDDSGDQEASTFEADAMAYFESNMRVSLKNGLAIEGAAIGRRASYIVGDKVRAVCEPYEQDQEIDTETLNLVFSVVGGATSVVEGGSSGAKTSPTQGINIASRLVRMGLGVMATLTPQLAGYRTVGALKEAAIRDMTQGAAEGGETTAPGYQEYEADAMKGLEADWQDMIFKSKGLIRTDSHPSAARALAEGVLPMQLTAYQDKVRTEYGSRSEAAGTMEGEIAKAMDPKMDILRQNLEEAKQHRKHVQELEAIGGGIAGGAAIGAGLGLLGGPFAPITVAGGAIGGAIVGGVLGLAAAAKIAWF